MQSRSVAHCSRQCPSRPQIRGAVHWLFIVHLVSSGSWQTVPSSAPVSATLSCTQSCPGSLQSRDVMHSLWQRLNAHTSGLLQSLLIAQPAATSPTGAVSSPPHAPRAIARTNKTEKQVRTDRIAFKVPSKLDHVKRLGS